MSWGGYAVNTGMYILPEHICKVFEIFVVCPSLYRLSKYSQQRQSSRSTGYSECVFTLQNQLTKRISLSLEMRYFISVFQLYVAHGATKQVAEEGFEDTRHRRVRQFL